MSYFLIAGEASGDLHGSALIRALKALKPDQKFLGVGGPQMVHDGLIPLCPFEDFCVMGFSDILFSYPKLRRHGQSIISRIMQEKPRGVILIDYPGFNLRLAQKLREKGYTGKLIQFIAPTVWAWKKGRIQTMDQSLDLVLTIFPFEAAYFTNSPFKTVYVGHPLMQTFKENPLDPAWRAPFQIPEERPLLALFPGSRPAEIDRNFPLQWEAAQLFQKKHPEYGIAIVSAQPNLAPLKSNCWQIPFEQRYHLMQDAACALAKSGTVTVELALSGCPSVIEYRLTLLNYFLARYLFRIRLPHYAMANILMSETLFPEWYGVAISPRNLVQSLEEQVQRKEWVRSKKETLREILSEKDAAYEAAREIAALCS
jgi:lipid-A-disaccharide synthase